MAATEEQFINKLILLYIFDQCSVALIEDIIVNDIATANGWISYMDCKDAIADLIKTDYLVNAAGKNSVPRYKITPDGRECLNCFFYKIPASTRDAIKEHIKKNIMSYSKQQDYQSDYFRNNDGTYTVVLKIVDDTSVWMELKLRVDNRTKAKWIYKTWHDKAIDIYGYLNENVIEN